MNYNTLYVLQPCIDSIVEWTKGLNYEIIVADNGSTDDSCKVLAQDNRITFIPIGENLGFGKGNNFALQHATGKYIFFLNSDTLLRNNAIKMLYDFSENYQGQLGALGCVLENSEEQPIHSYGYFPRMHDDIKKLLFVPIKKALHLYTPKALSLPEEWMKVEYVTGADLFVSRAVLDKCGSFNPAFFMYCEESEMQWRFLRKGYDNVLLNGPRIVHLEGESAKNNKSSQFLRDTLRQQKSEYIYFKLTEPAWKYCLYRLVHPILRQTLWLNPHASLSDKWKLFKQLFVRVDVK
ncbi:MAG: glycosyltransferase family 2 protein [Paludibacteraceae bacterium]|nr:glycosyltransferase family 2 protein [Paludibacteraceae bacterium]